jgi:autotransporter-associated beta strand protein
MNKKQTLITILICMAFTAINFGGRAFADNPTILDFSSATAEGEITIGNENASINIAPNGLITIKTLRGVTVTGVQENTYAGDVLINSGKIALGDVDGNGNQTRIVLDDSLGLVDINAPGNIEPTP